MCAIQKASAGKKARVDTRVDPEGEYFKGLIVF